MSKYKKGSLEYEAMINRTRDANTQGEPQTEEGYYNMLYNRYRIRMGSENARQLARDKTDEWKRYHDKSEG